MPRAKSARSTRSPSKPKEEPLDELAGAILASRTVKARTEAAAREQADRLVSPKRRILADKVEIERAD